METFSDLLMAAYYKEWGSIFWDFLRAQQLILYSPGQGHNEGASPARITKERLAEDFSSWAMRMEEKQRDTQTSTKESE